MPSRKKIQSTEIDLSEIIKILIKNLKKIVFITIITIMIVTFFFVHYSRNIKNETLYLAETKIEANSIFNEYKYNAYNSLVNNLISINSNNKNFFGYSNSKDMSFGIGNENIGNLKNYSFFESYNFQLIDRIYLYNLFVDKIRQNDLLENGIKKFGLVKINNYQNNEDYEKAIKNLVSSIIIEDKAKNEKYPIHTIKFKTDNKENWENFLYYIEKTANKEIQNYLNKKFKLSIIDLERIISYLIEDIEFEISNNLNDEKTIADLTSIKKRLLRNRYTEILNDLFYDTPIASLDKFTSAKIKILETEYSDISISKRGYTIEKIILLSTILGVILGILLALISNRPKKRR